MLNASASMEVSLALPGHRFTVIALDGNTVPTPAAVDVLKLDVAERADVIVEMNNPGVWVFGSTDDMDRNMGLGCVEYENRDRRAAMDNPDEDAVGLHGLWQTETAAKPDETIPSEVRKNSRRPRRLQPLDHQRQVLARHQPILHRSAGQALPAGHEQQQRRQHPVHTHRHTFEVTRVGDKPTSGLMKDTISMLRDSTAEIDFIADDPGPTFFHCHHQDHMDEGFAGLIAYS